MQKAVEVLSNEIITDKSKIDELFNNGKAPKILNTEIMDDITNNSTLMFLQVNRTIICHVSYLNKFDVIGSTSVMSSENHNEFIGKYYALENAINKIAELKAFSFLTK